MPRARFEKLSEEKKAQILGAATEEFAAKGFEGASYNQIIEKAGVSKGAMYYYFDDKMDLFNTVMLEASSKMIGLWEAALASNALETDFWEGFTAISRQQAQFAFENPELMALGKSLLEMDPAVAKAGVLGELYELSRTWIERIILKGQSVGAVRKDLPTGLIVAMLQAVGETFDRWFIGHMEEVTEGGPEALVALTVDIFRRIAEPRCVQDREGESK